MTKREKILDIQMKFFKNKRAISSSNMRPIIFDNEPVIYTTGTFLKPMKVTDSEGKEIWIWYVSEFNEDSFKDGEIYNPKEFANSKEDLLKKNG